MKIRKRCMAILAAALILAGSFPVFTVRADQEAGGEITLQEGSEASGTGTNDQEYTETPDTETPDIEAPDTEPPDTGTSDTEYSQTPDAGTFDTKTSDTETSDTEPSDTEPSDTETCNTGIFDIEDSQTPGNDNADDGQILDTGSAIIEETAGYTIPDDPPEFHACVVLLPSGYTVKATFIDDMSDIQEMYSLYSLDGENWQQTDEDDAWDQDSVETLQSLLLLEFDSMREPLQSYVAGEIERFYIKMHITREDGYSYESKPAVVECDNLQPKPIPDGITCSAYFSPEITVNDGSRKYCRYQITVSADTAVADVSGLLPDTLPVKVVFTNKYRPSWVYATAVIDCPVRWKPLSLLSLSAGESITISDAAESIQIPSGTQIKTPVEIFQLSEPLSLDTAYNSCDEVELVLNVISENGNPTGVLTAYPRDGLKISLHKKATGASSIKGYVLTEGESEWTELPGLSLLEELNAQPSTENSGYALVLRRDQEPYRSYLEAEAAGGTPTPFFVGLKFEGGIYDGKELILAWPDDYGQLPDLPKVGGISGNEGNVGAANKNDSTESGQRPNLPQTPDADREEQQPESSQPQMPDSRQESQRQILSEPDNNGQNQVPAVYISETADVITENQAELLADETVSDQQETGQRPNLSRTAPDTAGTPDVSQENGLTLEPFVVQAAAVEDIQEAGIVSDTPVLKTAVEPAIKPATSTGRGIFTPFLVVTTTAAVGGCIGAAVFKITGHSLFRQLAGTIRKLLHITK